MTPLLSRCLELARCLVVSRQVVIQSVALLFAGSAVAAPVTYTAFLVTDVSVGGVFYHNAAVTLTFAGDTRDIHLLTDFSVQSSSDPNGGGAFIERGRASVLVVSGTKHVSARIAPNQIIVSYDDANGGIGFSSYVGPNGFEPAYPFGLVDGTVQYRADPIAMLSTPMNFGGNAWSCIGYPPDTNDCTAPDAYPIKTDKGPLVIYNPYEAQWGDGSLGSHSGTMNRGVFSIARGAASEH